MKQATLTPAFPGDFALDHYSDGPQPCLPCGDSEPFGGREPPPEELPIPRGPGTPNNCLRCVAVPTISGDLRGRTKSNPVVRPGCDSTPQGRLKATISWNNSTAGAFFGEEYEQNMKATDASVLVRFEVFDRLVDLVKNTIGAVKAIPETAVAGGVKDLDNIAAALIGEVKTLLTGKRDLKRLVGVVDWEVEASARVRAVLKHGMDWYAYTQDGGAYGALAEVEVDGTRVDAVRLPPKEDPMTKDSVGELRRKTKRYGQDVASTPLILEQGGQNVRIIYTLDAGYGGLLDEDVRTKFADFQKKFQDAVTALVSALAAALPALLAGGGSVQEISAKLEAAFGASLSTVSAGLAAFLSLIFKLADQGLGYVKLHGTLLELRCLGPAPAG